MRDGISPSGRSRATNSEAATESIPRAARRIPAPPAAWYASGRERFAYRGEIEVTGESKGMKGRTRLAALLGFVLAAGCSNESQDLPPDAGVVRAVHAIPDLAVLTMNLDSNSLGDFDYAGIRGINRPGDGSHEIAFDVKLPGGDPPTRLETLNVATGLNRAQTIVLTGTAEQPETVTWDQPARDWAEEVANSDVEITVLEVSFGHAALGRGPLDFYLGPSPLDPTASSPVASLSYSDLSAIVEIDAGTQEIIVTPAGDPTTVVYESDVLSLPNVTSLLFVAFDGLKLDGDTPWLELRSLGDAFSNVMPNRLAPAEARAVHSARDSGPFDVVRHSNDETLIGDIAYGEVSPYVVVPTGSNTIDLKSVDDPDEVVAALTLSASPGADGTILISGEPDVVRMTLILDDNRRIATSARLRVINGAVTFPAVDIYVMEPGTNINDANPNVGLLAFPLGTSSLSFKAGDYDFVLAASGTRDIAVGPVRLTLENSGLYTVVATQAEQDDRIELILLDDLAE
jgi:hypothetical protein